MRRCGDDDPKQALKTNESAVLDFLQRRKRASAAFPVEIESPKTQRRSIDGARRSIKRPLTVDKLPPTALDRHLVLRHSVLVRYAG